MTKTHAVGSCSGDAATYWRQKKARKIQEWQEAGSFVVKGAGRLVPSAGIEALFRSASVAGSTGASASGWEHMSLSTQHVGWCGLEKILEELVTYPSAAGADPSQVEELSHRSGHELTCWVPVQKVSQLVNDGSRMMLPFP